MVLARELPHARGPPSSSRHSKCSAASLAQWRAARPDQVSGTFHDALPAPSRAYGLPGSSEPWQQAAAKTARAMQGRWHRRHTAWAEAPSHRPANLEDFCAVVHSGLADAPQLNHWWQGASVPAVDARGHGSFGDANKNPVQRALTKPKRSGGCQADHLQAAEAGSRPRGRLPCWHGLQNSRANPSIHH